VWIDIRWTAGDASLSRKYAAELVALAPHVILAAGGSTVEPLLQVSRAVPIVFAIAPDPVGAGYVDSLGRPRGNVTGFATFEFGLGAKWLELLNEIAPGRTRVAVIRDPAVVTGIGQFGAIQSAAPSMGIEVSPINLLDADQIERAVADFVRSAHDGLIVAASALATKHRNLIVGLAARHNLPAVYNQRAFVAAGGLISYGPDLVDQYRRAAGYVDRILKGEKARRPAGAGADQVRAGDQPQDREGARPRRANDAARPRRRGDRMSYAPALPPTLLGSGMALLG
jgi:putative ABC transport system substrate-binding protein